MRKDKKLAIKLRRENKSYNEISQILGVSKGTLSAWFKNYSFSKKVRNLLVQQFQKKSANRIRELAMANKEKWEKWREKARQEAAICFASLKNNPLFVAGLMLYWAEGDNKPENPFRLSNTDPRMIKLYVKFLTEALDVKKESIHLALILYPDLSEKECIKFWSDNTGINKSQFYKTQFIKGRHPTKRLTHGICMVICGNRQLKERALLWIDLLSKNL
jgi:predicted transcriptional regulator